ncbi:Cupin 1 [Dillenia turbinata]|uniref:Germin-like protein n=1 Tax=Dillenia turbinata TaxID=194707 RepID=A0AAN8Z3J1_9MAGN
MAVRIFLPIIVAFTFFFLSYSSDPTSLQDFCVADFQGPVKVNGFTCKDPTQVNANDFLFSGLHIPANTANSVGSNVTHVFVDSLRGLNTLGIGIARIDYAPYGVNAPHIHPRATEILTVLEGSLLAGFVTSNPENRLISKVLQKGDAFVFPMGLIHFQKNIGNTNAVAIATLGSQNPGVIIVANGVFGSSPPIPADILSKSFQLDEKTVLELQKRL